MSHITLSQWTVGPGTCVLLADPRVRSEQRQRLLLLLTWARSSLSRKVHARCKNNLWYYA